MPHGRIALPGQVPGDELAAGLAAIRTELSLPGDFSVEAREEAEQASERGHPDAASWIAAGPERVDLERLPFVTLDPLGSRDLDQAFLIERDGPGHTLRYAIADVAAHVRPGGAIESESLERGETVYLPGNRIPLHPEALSEGAASLLPGERRLAVVWTLSIDAEGEIARTDVGRATVRSTEQLSYDAAGAALGGGGAHPQLELLAELGPRLIAAARRRGAIELPEPAQELIVDAAGGWRLAWAPREPVEDWNAQLSLATGRAAAALMLRGGVGLLRTLPPAPAGAEDAIRLAARALGIEWPADGALNERLATLDPSDAAHLALLDRARSLLRGAGYLPLPGAEGRPPTADEAVHAAVAAPYAHVTAPLRRLGDRFATEAALAVAAGVAVPDWVLTALPALPDRLKASARRAGGADRAVVDLAEALALSGRVGEVFDAAVVEVAGKTAEIRIEEPPIRGRADGAGLEAGRRAAVVLTVADPVARTVRFAAAPDGLITP